jgi:hypothetical protein
LLDNIDIRGVEKLKDLAAEYMRDKQMVAQTQQDPNALKMQIEQAKLQLEQQKLQKDMMELSQERQLRERELKVKQDDATNESLRILLESEDSHKNNMVQMAKANAENNRSQNELLMKHIEIANKNQKNVE